MTPHRTSLLASLAAVLLCVACGDDATSGSSDRRPGSGEIQETQIHVGDLVFDARVAGPPDGEPVLLLHGFPSSSWEWKHQLRQLGLAGYRAVAPNQRGYSPGARPEAVEDYAMVHLLFDVLGMADALGWDRFHLVGHDWGAAVAWGVAVAFPDRLRSVAPISVPHPDAFAEELADPESCQASASGYFDLFVQPGFEETLVANDRAFLRSVFDGVDPADVEVHLAEIGNVDAMRAGLNWYRANVSRDGGLTPQPVGDIRVPTMFLWSDQDAALCREPAEATGDYVDAPYRFEIIEGVNHWVPEVAAEQVSALLLEHLATY